MIVNYVRLHNSKYELVTEYVWVRSSWDDDDYRALDAEISSFLRRYARGAPRVCSFAPLRAPCHWVPVVGDKICCHLVCNPRRRCPVHDQSLIPVSHNGGLIRNSLADLKARWMARHAR